METGVEHNKQRLHKVGYFHELLSTNQEVHPCIRPLLKISRETIERCQKTEYALVQLSATQPRRHKILMSFRHWNAWDVIFSTRVLGSNGTENSLKDSGDLLCVVGGAPERL
jgi:hypothetical protein